MKGARSNSQARRSNRALKRKLLAHRRTTAAFDANLFARHLEAAYTMMHERHLAGLAPDDFVVPASQE